MEEIIEKIMLIFDNLENTMHVIGLVFLIVMLLILAIFLCCFFLHRRGIPLMPPKPPRARTPAEEKAAQDEIIKTISMRDNY